MTYHLKVQGRNVLTTDDADSLLFILWDYITLHSSEELFIVIELENGRRREVNILRFLLVIASGHSAANFFAPYNEALPA